MNNHDWDLMVWTTTLHAIVRNHQFLGQFYAPGSAFSRLSKEKPERFIGDNKLFSQSLIAELPSLPFCHQNRSALGALSSSSLDVYLKSLVVVVHARCCCCSNFLLII